MQPPRSPRRSAFIARLAPLLALSFALTALAASALAAPTKYAKATSGAEKPAADKAHAEKPAADKALAKKSRARDDKKDARKTDKKGGKDTPKGPLSIGAPNRGRLLGSVRLAGSKHLKLRGGSHSWGLPTLVKALRRASDKVAKKHPRSMLLVGDLSARAGGSLAAHNSHQTGRDADVGFYTTNSKGKPVAMKRFITFDAAGNGIGVPWARFDDARNWALVEALLEDKDAGVRYLFISSPLRARLLAFAAQKKVPKDLLLRAAAAMMSPKDADLHDDHFHVRIACPEEMRGVCAEEAAAREGSSNAQVTYPAEAAPAPASAAAPAPPEADVYP